MTFLAGVLALLVGLALGLLGGGGSILTVPIFRYALAMGVKESIGMSLGVVSTIALAGAFRHWRQKNIDLKALAAFAPAAIVSTFLGAKLAQFVPDAFQLIGLGVVMLTASYFMWSGKNLRSLPEGETHPAPRPVLIVATGLGLGILTGVIGVGGGFLIVPALVLLLGLDIKRAVGTSLGVIALNAAAGFIGYLGHIAMNWVLMGWFVAVAVIGVFGGAALVPMVSQRQLRRGFAVFLILVAALILVRR